MVLAIPWLVTLLIKFPELIDFNLDEDVMKLKKFFTYSIILLTAGISACVPSKRESKTSTQRLNVPNWGITIDASYDKKLDEVVPGYKILTVAITNRSVDMIKLDPNNDQWTIEDAWGRKQKAIVSMRIRDPRVWDILPPKMKDLVEYPAGVQMGYSQTFNLFFPEAIELEGFRAIAFYSAVMKQNFDAVASSSLERAVPAGGEEDSPVPDKFNPQPVVKKGTKISAPPARQNPPIPKLAPPQ